MRCDTRLSGVLHVMLHMAEMEGPVTSEAIAKLLGTNAVVVRRIMAGLRDSGFLRSEKGHGGGWTIERDLDSITLHDVYASLGHPEMFAMGHRNESPECLVEQTVNASLGRAFQDAKAILLDRFANVTLAELSEDFHTRLAKHGISLSTLDMEAIHGA